MAIKSITSASMANAGQMHNQSRMSAGPSAIKVRQHSIIRMASSDSSTKLPALAELPKSALHDRISGVSGSRNQIKSRNKSVSLAKSCNSHKLRAIQDQYGN